MHIPLNPIFARFTEKTDFRSRITYLCSPCSTNFEQIGIRNDENLSKFSQFPIPNVRILYNRKMSKADFINGVVLNCVLRQKVPSARISLSLFFPSYFLTDGHASTIFIFGGKF